MSDPDPNQSRVSGNGEAGWVLLVSETHSVVDGYLGVDQENGDGNREDAD